uniref:Venom polypeptide n=1 Tax=Dolopus genitalis TaxID=2488630 RepID=A0A3G5BID7_DOLGE|nr:venom polypeptide [Dolopus genitalis]
MANFLNIFLIITLLCGALYGANASYRCVPRGGYCFNGSTLKCCRGVTTCINNRCR